MEYLVEENNNSENNKNNKINIFEKIYIEKYGENHKVVLRRLKKELLLFENNNIDYKISVNPIRKKSLNRQNLVQIEFNYLNYNLYIFISEYYPFERPLLMIDKLSIDERKYRVQDGLENSIIGFLHNYISEFVNNTNVNDLISIKEFVENNYVVPKHSDDIDLRRVYYLKVEKYFAPSVLLDESYRIMIEGIHLAFNIE
jgi:hypothetical protein